MWVALTEKYMKIVFKLKPVWLTIVKKTENRNQQLANIRHSAKERALNEEKIA